MVPIRHDLCSAVRSAVCSSAASPAALASANVAAVRVSCRPETSATVGLGAVWSGSTAANLLPQPVARHLRKQSQVPSVAICCHTDNSLYHSSLFTLHSSLFTPHSSLLTPHSLRAALLLKPTQMERCDSSPARHERRRGTKRKKSPVQITSKQLSVDLCADSPGRHMGRLRNHHPCCWDSAFAHLHCSVLAGAVGKA